MQRNMHDGNLEKLCLIVIKFCHNRKKKIIILMVCMHDFAFAYKI